MLLATSSTLEPDLHATAGGELKGILVLGLTFQRDGGGKAAGGGVFAAVTTACIPIAIQFEERDLVIALGAAYRACQRDGPMVISFTKGWWQDNSDRAHDR